jgi:hypothetical protein
MTIMGRQAGAQMRLFASLCWRPSTVQEAVEMLAAWCVSKYDDGVSQQYDDGVSQQYDDGVSQQYDDGVSGGASRGGASAGYPAYLSTYLSTYLSRVSIHVSHGGVSLTHAGGREGRRLRLRDKVRTRDIVPACAPVL